MSWEGTVANTRRKGSKQLRRGGKSSSNKARPASRAGSHAGRGFRYQDAVSVWLTVEVWAGRRPSATVIPEGGDDIEMRGAFTSFVQVNSRREHLGGYHRGRSGETHRGTVDQEHRIVSAAPTGRS